MKPPSAERILYLTMRRFFLLIGCWLGSCYAVVAQSPETVLAPTSVKFRQGTKAAVVSAHPLASRVGIGILQQGGNAFDAAIATQLALAVVYPNAGNIGGGGMLVAYTAQHKPICIDYRETAPGAAFKDMYLDTAGNPVPGLSLNGHRAAAVPGTVAGLFETHRYARLPFRTLIQPAIDLADKGFPLTAAQADSLNRFRDRFLRYNRLPTAFTSKLHWLPGDTLKQPELAATLKRIQAKGSAGFYRGETASLIEAEMIAGGGLIRKNDLASYRAKHRQVLSFPYHQYQVYSMPLPSSGGMILWQLLGMLQGIPLGSYGFHSAAALQYMIEAERRAYADRAEFYGDPDFVSVPVNQLLNPAYLRQRMHDVEPGKAGRSDATHAGRINESDHTTHISIIDADGNAVSVTTTLNGYYGSLTVVAGAGFLLNNEMDDFSIKPGVPNLFGVTGNTANAIHPGKRMLSSMTPTIVLEKGKPVIIVGSPGGSTIPTSVFQTIVNLIEFRLPAREAVNAPKFHHQWLPDRVDLEVEIPDSVRNSLQKMGYAIFNRPSIGRVELIHIQWKKGKKHIEAVADKRGDDAAEAY